MYNLNGSDTWTSATDSNWNVTNIDPTAPGGHTIRGYDDARFGTNITLPQFPLEVWSQADSSNRSELPLGLSSSWLTKLEEADAIPHKTVGLYYGSRSMNRPQDGELVIGGYNKGRVNGPFHNFSLGMNYHLTEPCPLQVLLTNVIVRDAKGRNSSLIPDTGTRVPACINPVENAFTFSQSMFATWAKVTHHPSTAPADGSHNFSAQTYPRDAQQYISDLVVVLDGDYEVVIPHYELLSLERGDNAQGLYDVVNASRIQAAVQSTDDVFDFPILGGVFLSQQYLLVDYINKRFGLAPAVVDENFPVSRKKYISTCGAEADNSTVAKIPSLAYAPSSHPHRLSAGAIVGLVFGVLIGKALAIALAIFLYRRRQREKDRRDRLAQEKASQDKFMYGHSARAYSPASSERHERRLPQVDMQQQQRTDDAPQGGIRRMASELEAKGSSVSVVHHELPGSVWFAKF